MPKKIKKIISIIGVGGGGQPDDVKFHHVFTFFFLNPSLSLNLAYPFEDWDQGRFSVREYQKRHRQTNIEMAWTLSVNILYSFIMLIPLFYTGITRLSKFYRKTPFYFRIQDQIQTLVSQNVDWN